MIYVDITKLKALIPPDLQKKLEEATSKLMTLPEGERATFINRRASLWSEVKPYLVQLTGAKHPEDYKCWYCEAKDIRSKYDVDHFRPKNQVKNKGCSSEPGYWWLAFDPMNYRLSCSLCNTPKKTSKKSESKTLGKWDQFPLKENSPRAQGPEDNIDDEICLLLDPTKLTDPGLITFSDDGRAYPRHQKKETFSYQKAFISMDALNLNDIRILEARKQVRQKCMEKIEEGDREFAKYSSNGSPSAFAAFNLICKQIVDLVSINSELSATALCYFYGSGREWVLDLLRLHQSISKSSLSEQSEQLGKTG